MTSKSQRHETDRKDSEGASDGEGEIDCPVCLLTAVHPVKLPCSHVFCYLCVKGTANRSKCCALCRKEIPPHYLLKPELIKTDDLNKDISFDDGHQWYYEGTRGWWQYDERTSGELESNYKDKCKNIEILIAGFLYIVDFENMVQYRRNDRSRRRRIKRDLITIPKKGIAGLKFQRPTTIAADRSGGDGNDDVDDAASGGSVTATVKSSPSVKGRNTNNNAVLPATASNSTGQDTPSISPLRQAVSDTDIVNRNSRLAMVSYSDTQQGLNSNNIDDLSGTGARNVAGVGSETEEDSLPSNLANLRLGDGDT